MLATNYVGLDIHKKTISFCVRQSDGTILQEGTLAANCEALDGWLPGIPQPWIAGMEATMFTGWVYDHLLQYSAQVKVAHPVMLKAISAGKKKNDRADAQKMSDLLRCNYFPECHSFAGNSRPTKSLALSQSNRSTERSDEKPGRIYVDGDRYPL